MSATNGGRPPASLAPERTTHTRFTAPLPGEPVAAGHCGRCGAEIASALLACPGCGALVHATRLTELAAEADALEVAGDVQGAIARWREAFELLPAAAPQSAEIAARIGALSDRIAGGAKSAGASSGSDHPNRKLLGGGGAIAVLLALLLKSKWLIAFLLTKGKLLLLGLTKAKTAFSMLAFLGVYWQMYGWKFALGVVLAIYVHEMGHVFAMRRFGIAADAPMFIPGIGAFIRARQTINNVRENARIGLAGPLWGLGATVVLYGAYMALRSPVLGAIAGVSAVLNLFNLLPVLFLDGGRGFSTLTRGERWTAAGAVAVMAVVTWNPWYAGLAGVCAFVALAGTPSDRSDRRMLALYVCLTAALALLAHLSLVAMRIEGVS